MPTAREKSPHFNGTTDGAKRNGNKNRLIPAVDLKVGMKTLDHGTVARRIVNFKTGMVLIHFTNKRRGTDIEIFKTTDLIYVKD